LEATKNEIEITTYDRLLRAWENSKELVRDYEMYSKKIDEKDISETFKIFAEDEAVHASRLREMLLEYRSKR
jgi:rubrerythrin